MSVFLAAGQLAATQGTILAPQSGDTRVNVTLSNTSAVNTETINLLAKNSVGTAYAIVQQIVLAPLEAATVSGLNLDSADTLLANTTDATTVSYRITQATGSGPLEVNTYDKNGNKRTVAASTATSTGTVGVSTAAAGTTTADAGVLPAATADTYPTTAADGTKGVRINAADQITGRRLFIGNGVSTAILKIYAPAGGTINGAAADVAFSTVSGKGGIVECLSGSGNTWLAW